MRRRQFVAGAVATGVAAPALGQDAIKMRISLDTSAAHSRTVLTTRWAEEIKKRSSGKLHTEIFHSAQLFRDRDVGKALRQGGAEVGVPGSWNLTGIEPNLDLVQLPSFYGRTAEEMHKVSDGEVGNLLNDSLGKKLGIHVFGKWLDLGAAHTYSTSKPLNGPGDLKGLKIRTSGGAGQFVRVKFFEAIPNFTAWPDVPLALSQGTFDALITTNESCASAKLWESGVKHSLQDYQYFAQYIPMASAAFWAKLPADLQKLVTATWADMVGGFRQEMAQSQAHSLELMKKNGVTVVSPTSAVLEETRRRLLATQDEVARELKLDLALVAKANAALGVGRS